MDKHLRQKSIIPRYKRLLAAGAVLAALAAAVSLVFGWEGQYLLLSNDRTGKILFCAPAGDGVEFSVSYTHSVNKSPVTEYYQILDSRIYLTALRYKTFGAGMPTEPEEAQTLRYEEDDMIIEGFARPMPYLCYSIGRIAGHALHWRGQAIRLDTLDTPGQPVLFSVINYPRLLRLFHIYPDTGQLRPA